MSTIESLFQPIQIGKLLIPNRFVMSPMTRSFSPNGIPSETVAGYYRRRAEGQVGLIITEGIGIDHPAAIGDSGLGDADQPVLHGEKALDAWRSIVASVHAAGGIIAPQLWHQGPLRINGTGLVPSALSCRPSPIGGPEGRATAYPPEIVQKLREPTAPMSESDIADTIAAYARSAANAKSVGFDAIAIHGAHSYLIDAFLWQDSNQRSDQWGGELSNRMRYGIEVLKAIRSAIGSEMPIIFRFSQWKQSDFDAQIAKTPKELEQILGGFADAGVDVFDASTRRYQLPAFPDVDKHLTLAGWAKKLSGKPSMAVGGIGLQSDIYESFGAGGSAVSDNINDVAKRIEAEEFDFACLGRALISESQWPEKLLRGKACKPFSMEDLGALN
jgi:2,4-dienoyl-CoA reductase-like NADH-dependent reductase (Old Yellow Enzyme family)